MGLGWFGMVWDGLGWFGMVWDGLGWFGTVWDLDQVWRLGIFLDSVFQGGCVVLESH